MRVPLVFLLGTLLLLTWRPGSAVGQTTDTVPSKLIQQRIPSVRAAAQADIATNETAHNQGNIQLSVSNSGRFGLPYSWDIFGQAMPVIDPLSNDPIQRCTYPANSGHVFLLDSYMWIGAIAGYDTLNCMFDWQPLFYGVQPFRYSSAERARTGIYSSTARSDLDIRCEYLDTVLTPFHTPIGLRIYQRSMAWAGKGSDDFVLVECQLENVTDHPLNDIYVGLSFNNPVIHITELGELDLEFDKFYTGYLPTYPRANCLSEDTINLAYAMVADPRPTVKRWSKYSARAAAGFRFIAAPVEKMTPNYNWEAWLPGYMYYSPRKRATPEDPYRQFHEYGPETAGELYYFLSHPEIDYDQIFAAKDRYVDGWFPPPPEADRLASGYPATATTSLGGFDLPPGAKGTIIYAIVAGDSVIIDPMLYSRFNPQQPDWLYSRYDFSHLAANAVWAGRVYDNPGYDTDGDGYSGTFELCNGDTVWVRGDGVPDWRADGPPSPPDMRVIPSLEQLAIRWNGFRSETSIDPLTRVRDFEGYNVFLGLDERPSSFSLLTSFDREDWVRYRLTGAPDGSWDWRPTNDPYSLAQLREYYLDPDFDPSLYDREHPLVINGEYLCFLPQGNNAPLAPDKVHKVYPDAVKPSDDTLQWTDDDVIVVNGKRLAKYYEYEYIIDKLLPTVQYWAAVTAFDFGFATAGITAQESRLQETITSAWAIPSSAEVAGEKASVYVWPNPYRYDGDYELKGYENHDQSLYIDRGRRIHFGNLPARCKISILSLDGDLVREIIHEYAPDDPNSTHDAWDLITKNYQLAVSGIYYWVVESATGNQTGKLVVIQ